MSPPLYYWFIALPASTLAGALFTEAIAAVNRAVATGPEWNRGILATFGAYHGMHLTWALAVSTAATGLASRLSAGGTSLGLVSVTLFCMIRLIVRSENKGLVTFLASEIFILVVHHRFGSFLLIVGENQVTEPRMHLDNSVGTQRRQLGSYRDTERP